VRLVHDDVGDGLDQDRVRGDDVAGLEEDHVPDEERRVWYCDEEDDEEEPKKG
jgi:hypothetical protein